MKSVEKLYSALQTSSMKSGKLHAQHSAKCITDQLYKKVGSNMHSTVHYKPIVWRVGSYMHHSVFV